ncbi:MAG: DUF4392 domain-containing protein [Chloroflexi bacterium]|nr:DUF4392 domain-containing protein [Chloroflexota bacterium]
MSAIEDIILARDRRGISALRPLLPQNFCQEAAKLMLERPGPVLICTGFYILSVGAPETDGPPGAYFLGQALEALGYPVTYVSDRYSAFLLEGLAFPGRLVDFPISPQEDSRRFAQELLLRLKPSLVISIERCGLTSTGQYLNMRGVDISRYNAMLDYLFLLHEATVGIGDGGNEIGMGNLAEHIPAVPSLPREPCATRVASLVIASVSNWGGYGLTAALSQITGRDLLPTPGQEEGVIRRMVDRGAVDGMLGKTVYSVDSFPLEENRQTLEQLRAYLAGASPSP